MTTDLIVIQPRSVDFPYWRMRITGLRKHFNKVIIVMTQQANSIDVTETIKTLPEVTVLENIVFDGRRDWRDIATNMALNESQSERVLFMEQDLLFEDKTLLKSLDQALPVAFLEQGRIHPAFVLARRKLIEKTSRDFSVDLFYGDHFGMFTAQLFYNSVWVNLSDIGKYLHLAGTTQNYMVYQDHPEQMHLPERFYSYNNFTMKYDIPYDLKFLEVMKSVRDQSPASLVGNMEVLNFL